MSVAREIDTSAVDDKALELRRDGASFKTIAKKLNLARSADANAAFQRSLRRRPAAERKRLRRDELERLDKLAARVRASQEHSPDQVARRLAVVARMRAKLLAD